MNEDMKRQIPGAFGCVDLKFALHPLDQERAKELLIAALSDGVDFKDYYEAIESWLRDELTKKHYPQDLMENHVKAQMARVCDVSAYFSVDSRE